MTQQEGSPSVQTYIALERAKGRLERRLGRQPTIDELAGEMGLSGPEVKELVEAAQRTITFRPIQ
jgi:DNA-directed RNA polymerase sigma subunit (sigma70/sigma32)